MKLSLTKNQKIASLVGVLAATIGLFSVPSIYRNSQTEIKADMTDNQILRAKFLSRIENPVTFYLISSDEKLNYDKLMEFSKEICKLPDYLTLGNGGYLNLETQLAYGISSIGANESVSKDLAKAMIKTSIANCSEIENGFQQTRSALAPVKTSDPSPSPVATNQTDPRVDHPEIYNQPSENAPRSGETLDQVQSPSEAVKSGTVPLVIKGENVNCRAEARKDSKVVYNFGDRKITDPLVTKINPVPVDGFYKVSDQFSKKICFVHKDFIVPNPTDDF